MIKTTSEKLRYQARFSNGQNGAFSDTIKDKGGGGFGFRPHELLEAALARCINITIRMCADKYSIPLSKVTTTVRLNRSNPDEAVFEGEYREYGVRPKISNNLAKTRGMGIAL